jgi:hypothetical protein
VLPPDIVDREHEGVELMESESENKMSEREEMCSLKCSLKCSLSDVELDRILCEDNQNLVKGNHRQALACGEVH